MTFILTPSPRTDHVSGSIVKIYIVVISCLHAPPPAPHSRTTKRIRLGTPAAEFRGSLHLAHFQYSVTMVVVEGEVEKELVIVTLTEELS